MPKSKSAATPRARPNVLITGTPGTGKTSLAERVAAACGMHHYDVSAVAKREDMCESFDEDLDTHVIDEDKVLDHMEEKLGASDGGIVADYHSCDLFPERWFDLVVVLTCDNSILYDRLAARVRRGEDHEERGVRDLPGDRGGGAGELRGGRREGVRERDHRADGGERGVGEGVRGRVQQRGRRRRVNASPLNAHSCQVLAFRRSRSPYARARGSH